MPLPIYQGLSPAFCVSHTSSRGALRLTSMLSTREQRRSRCSEQRNNKTRIAYEAHQTTVHVPSDSKSAPGSAPSDSSWSPLVLILNTVVRALRRERDSIPPTSRPASATRLAVIMMFGFVLGIACRHLRAASPSGAATWIRARCPSSAARSSPPLRPSSSPSTRFSASTRTVQRRRRQFLSIPRAHCPPPAAPSRHENRTPPHRHQRRLRLQRPDVGIWKGGLFWWLVGGIGVGIIRCSSCSSSMLQVNA